MITGSTALLYNRLITGDPTSFPIMVYADQFFGPNTNALGFGPDRGMGWAIDPYPGHSPRDAVINANLNTASINVEMLGWSIGSLLIAGVMVFSGALRRSDYLMLGVIAAVFIPHFFYYFSGGPDFAARYWFLMIVPGVALTARGIQFLEGKFSASPDAHPSTSSGRTDFPADGEHIGGVYPEPGRRAQGRPVELRSRYISEPSSNASSWVTAAVVALSVLALVNYFPWRSLDKYHDFRGMRPDVRVLAQEYNFGRSLVLVRGERHPDYASASIYNPLDLQADAPVYVWDRSPEVRAKVLEVYADRPVWLVDGPTVTHAGYQVVDGPLPASALLAASSETP
jgi:hypothetical protein